MHHISLPVRLPDFTSFSFTPYRPGPLSPDVPVPLHLQMDCAAPMQLTVRVAGRHSSLRRWKRIYCPCFSALRGLQPFAWHPANNVAEIDL